jgi:hypothetical protein
VTIVHLVAMIAVTVHHAAKTVADSVDAMTVHHAAVMTVLVVSVVVTIAHLAAIAHRRAAQVHATHVLAHRAADVAQQQLARSAQHVAINPSILVPY